MHVAMYTGKTSSHIFIILGSPISQDLILVCEIESRKIQHAKFGYFVNLAKIWRKFRENTISRISQFRKIILAWSRISREIQKTRNLGKRGCHPIIIATVTE